MALANKVWATMALAFGMSTANAQTAYIEPGKCYPIDATQATLKADGQKPIFVGQRVTAAKDVRPTNVIMMNDNGYGFNFEQTTDKKEICLRALFKNVILNYPENPNIPVWGQKIKPTNGIDIVKAYQNGSRLVFVAQTYEKNADGAEIKGKSIVLGVSPETNTGTVQSVTSDGIPSTSFVMGHLKMVKENFDYFMGRGFNTGIAANASGTVVALSSTKSTTGPAP